MDRRKSFGSTYCKIEVCFGVMKCNSQSSELAIVAPEQSEIFSNLTAKTPERRYLRRSGGFILNFEHISHLVLIFLLLTLKS